MSSRSAWQAAKSRAFSCVGVPWPLHERLAEGVALENGERVAAGYLAGEMGLAAGRKAAEYEKRRGVDSVRHERQIAASSTETSRWSQRERGFCARADSGRRLRGLPGDADEAWAGVHCHCARELRYEQLLGREARLQAVGQLLCLFRFGRVHYGDAKRSAGLALDQLRTTTIRSIPLSVVRTRPTAPILPPAAAMTGLMRSSDATQWRTHGTRPLRAR